MSKICNSILETIGNTPLIKINKLNNTNADILAKVEYFNPAGSIKDRAALFLIEKAEEQGLINKDTVIIEPTSGNTGIGLALVCLIKGYKLILTMPETMSIERQKYLKVYGASVYLTKGNLQMQGAIDKAFELHKEIKNSFIPSQFDNPSNILAHYETTANEIYNDTNGKVDVVIAGIGTGGTISGIGKRLKELNKNIEIIGFEPSNSPLITKGTTGKHNLQGIGANFLPKNFKKEYVDKIYTVSDEDAIKYTKLLAKKEGLFVGITSGACLSLALNLAKQNEYKNKKFVLIFPDGGAKYMSCVNFD